MSENAINEDVNEYVGIDDFIEQNQANIEQWKKDNGNKAIYPMCHNLTDFGKIYMMVLQPSAAQYETMRLAAIGDKQYLDKAYNLLHGELLLYPNKDKFASLYREHSQYGLVNAIVNEIGLHLGYSGDTISKKV